MDMDRHLRAFEGAIDHENDEPATPARPMFDRLGLFLIGSIICAAIACLWVGFSWGSPHG